MVEKEKDIEKLRKGESVGDKSEDDDRSSQSSRISMHSVTGPMSFEIGLMGDSFTNDYVRNIFGKYLIYMANKKEKKAKT